MTTDDVNGAAGAADAPDPERSDPLGALLDAVVFAPVGAFLHGPETVGDLAAKGRQDVANARLIGKMALDRARREGSDRTAALLAEVGERVVGLVVAAARAAGAPLADDAPPTSRPDTGPATLRVVGGAQGADDPPASEAALGAPDVASLAIPGYDTLAASQVVPRLEDLSDDELAAVQDYERAHRARVTILSRIAQLRAS